PKLPLADGSVELDPLGVFAEEKVSLTRPAADLLRTAEESLDAACTALGVWRTELLYARVDLVRDGAGAPLLLEVELTEPGLGFAQADAAAVIRFASAIRASIAECDARLSPASHRIRLLVESRDGFEGPGALPDAVVVLIVRVPFVDTPV